ncbi:hypothetical protein P3T43_000260 [Paraburkholderia sp. GAS41]|jgi:hypothetical protein
MKLHGNLLIGAQELSATAGTMKALNPATNLEIEPPFAPTARAWIIGCRKSHSVRSRSPVPAIFRFRIRSRAAIPHPRWQRAAP